MADTYTIQFRRGMYADFDTSKIRPGEPVAILGNDPSVPSGKALYIAFAANDVRRLCSIEDISEMVNAGEFVGPQGPKGEKGDKGDPGEKGADGTVAFESLTPEQKESLRGISIKSASVDTDGNLTIMFSDGDSEDVGNIMGPQGIQGPKGDKGDVGPQGLKGDKGDVGPKGDNMSDEQAQQIEQNKTDIASLKTETGSLKEDISTKITKFYASSQGETHLADSDNGKIMDMMVYGKSEQKRYSGKNLLNATLQTTTQNGITCTANGDGTYTLNGTATAITVFDIAQDVSCSSFRLVGCPVGGVHDASYELQARTNNLIYGYDTGDGKNIKADENFSIRIRINDGINCNNLLFKPMIVDASLYPDTTYDDFKPYTGGIPSPNPDYPQEIKSVVNPTVKVCGKNLAQPLMPTTTVDGVTVTNNGDGTYTLNGTAIANATFRLDQSGYGKADNLKKYKGTYTFSRSNTSYEARVMQHNTWKQVMYLGIGSQSITKKIDIDDCFVFISTSKGTTYNNVLVDLQIEFGSTATAFEPYHEQTATLPYTLNAIPVSAGGNVTIDGQQYISDYADVERGKLVNMVDSSKLDNTQSIVNKTEWLLAKPQEIDLTQEEVQAFKTFVTYYPTTNISVNSKQLDGYTVFNYPISMANGWNYVKKQLNDNRDYIYDMDMQSAEAYVNSEYAVALTELEV